MRENGYYWIILDDHISDPVTEKGWEVAYFEREEGWYSIWDGGSYKDEDVKQIDENRLLRE